MKFLQRRQGLLEAIVFSGGEPLLQSGLGIALARCREMGFATSLHSAGSSPARLARLLPLLGKRPGIYRIDPTCSGLPFLNFAATDPTAPAPI